MESSGCTSSQGPPPPPWQLVEMAAGLHGMPVVLCHSSFQITMMPCNKMYISDDRHQHCLLYLYHNTAQVRNSRICATIVSYTLLKLVILSNLACKNTEWWCFIFSWPELVEHIHHHKFPQFKIWDSYKQSFLQKHMAFKTSQGPQICTFGTENRKTHSRETPCQIYRTGLLWDLMKLNLTSAALKSGTKDEMQIQHV